MPIAVILSLVSSTTKGLCTDVPVLYLLEKEEEGIVKPGFY